jgi:hypothetical protein
MLRRKRLLLGIAVVILLPAIGLGWWLLSPLFLNQTVEEEFPIASSASVTVPEGMTQAQVEQKLAEMASVNTEVMEPMPDMMGSAPFESGGETIFRAHLYFGEFRDADSFHKGSGKATIYRALEGPLLLRLENFRVTNGPDLHVLLTSHPDPKSREDLRSAGYVDLGKLKGNLGNQNYPIPAGVAPAAPGSVVIYCLPFQVVFSVAPLNAEG